MDPKSWLWRNNLIEMLRDTICGEDQVVTLEEIAAWMNPSSQKPEDEEEVEEG